jgi:hypothetical protein
MCTQDGVFPRCHHLLRLACRALCDRAGHFYTIIICYTMSVAPRIYIGSNYHGATCQAPGLYVTVRH